MQNSDNERWISSSTIVAKVESWEIFSDGSNWNLKSDKELFVTCEKEKIT